jgi:hypothetical protein
MWVMQQCLGVDEMLSILSRLSMEMTSSSSVTNRIARIDRVSFQLPATDSRQTPGMTKLANINRRISWEISGNFHGFPNFPKIAAGNYQAT